MHAIINAHTRAIKTTGRVATLACASVAGSVLLAGCASGPEIDPIYKVVPPAQQYTCSSGTPNCTPARFRHNTATRY